MKNVIPEVNSKSMDIVTDNISKLKELFPEAFTEGKVDFDALKEVLGKYVDGREERYSFTWNGKSKARMLAQTPSTGTLRPCKEESVDWDTTQNLFIEGDNLEVLKLLQKSYHKKIKMIYIDPPYNTGKDFVYKDNFKDNIRNYKEITGQVDGEGRNLSSNPETSGRYHTDWLNMMYPRLKLARNLLKDDGLIFISIDDNEVSNLRSMCDEIFGEENFVASFIWNTEGHSDNQFDVKVNHEYVLLYEKTGCSKLGYVIDPNTREESNLWKGFAENSITKNGDANPPSEIELPVGFPCVEEELSLPPDVMPDSYYAEIEKLGYITREISQKYNASYPIRKDDVVVSEFKLAKKCTVYSGWANANKLKAFISNGCQPLIDGDDTVRFYLSKNGVIYYYKDRSKARNILSVLRNMGTTERMRSELESDGVIFKYPKPLELLSYLIKVGGVENDIVLDFFAGSATSAHAVMKLNAEDRRSRKFIMVQFPEAVDEKSGASMAGYKTIAEISKERIRRAAAKLKKENPDYQGDLGFKVFKLDSTNIKPWELDFDLTEQDLEDQISNIKQGRREEDVLYEVLLKYGLDLTLPITEHSVAGHKVFDIGMGALMICLSDDITLDVVEGIAKLKDELKPEIMRVVFKDAGFADDVVKTNAVQILKQAGIEDVRSL